MKENKQEIDYGNWMPKKLIYGSLLLFFIFTILTILINWTWLKIILAVFSGFFILTSVYFISGYRAFSKRGLNLQEKVHDLIVDNLKWDGNGTCLDVGCGSAAVSIKIAKKYPKAKIIAGDYWGNTGFEYDQNQCEINARLENVIDQMEFKNINAGNLPFEDASIDAIVSNLVYHEVKDFKMKEKHKGILESLRVLKNGSVFAVQDVFGSEAIYGDFETLVSELKKNVTELNYVDSFKTLNMPKWLNNPIMLGGIGIFYGVK